jgi:multidrug efflux pump subunit AcrB
MEAEITLRAVRWLAFSFGPGTFLVQLALAAIILIVPMCLLAAISGVYLSGMDNNIFTQIGLIVLVGLACKNAA